MTLSLEPNLCLLNKKIKETIKMFPWYKRLIEDDKIESITNIPLMTSDILEKYYYSNPLVGNYDVYQTSGTSSGNRKKIFYSPEDDENYIKLRANIYRKFIPIDSMKLVFSDMGTGHAANTAKKVFESLNLSFESVSYDAPIE
jgi:phenylacetate-coenzyme A ligase PaaK-like adenylate-forming protein